MQTYLVGGYVRDLLMHQLLGYPIQPSDRDWVVVGASPDEMLQQGFLPVGKDFPVFLHPQTHEEYALARTERKISRGYHGFRFYAQADVSLEEDLKRRDLTINAIAMKGNQLIDPYGGVEDIKAKCFRHVSEAFSEDPVRILRVARFAARFKEFSVAESTMQLMTNMVNSGEADSLVGERIFKEMRRALMANAPERFIQTLQACGCWQRLFAEVPINPAQLSTLKKSADIQSSELVRFAVLSDLIPSEESLNGFCEKIKPTAEIRDLMILWHRTKNQFENSPEGLLNLMQKADAFRRPQRYQSLLAVAKLVLSYDELKAKRALEVASSIDTKRIARETENKRTIANSIYQARLRALKEAIL